MRSRIDLLGRLRRRSAQALDQLRVRLTPSAQAPGAPPPWDGSGRFAILTVNYHTTHYLKLMLLTLAEQQALHRLLTDIVIVDQCSRDGGVAFLQRLAEAVDCVALTRRQRRLHHAVGMRAAVTTLETRNAGRLPTEQANILLFCDPDVIFLRDDTLMRLSACFSENDGISHAGELRTHLHPLPEAQASFLAVRRDWAARPGISPFVHHGSPAWWMQRDLQNAGGVAAHFPGNADGFVLHRGRSAVQAASRFAPSSPYAGATSNKPHYMGVENGAERWAGVEARWSPLLETSAEDRLIDHLSARYSRNAAPE